jgi:hypothetical protein
MCAGHVRAVERQRQSLLADARSPPGDRGASDEARCVTIEVWKMDTLAFLIAFALGFGAGYGIREWQSQIRRRRYGSGGW